MGKVVLVVEDNEDNLLIVATILRHYGYQVLTASDGEAALTVARAGMPQLILLDISLPKLDGWQVAVILKSDAATVDIPIIAFPAHAYHAERMRAFEQGFAGFLTKPVEPLRILDEVRRNIGDS